MTQRTSQEPAKSAGEQAKVPATIVQMKFLLRCIRAFVLAALCLVATAVRVHAAAWNGFLDVSTNLLTQNFSFTGTTNPAAGDSNENYYDGDMGDIDGDGWMDRALIARYGILLNTG